LAYALNGERLTQDHGFPLRAIVPGWVGSSSIKWLDKIVVSREPLWTRNNTEAYVLVGDGYAPEGEALGEVITTQVVNSALALPWPATLPAGTHRLQGFAHSPFGGIAGVEWSDDRGATWHATTLVGPQLQYSWVRFEFWWEATLGEQTILTRAIDIADNCQPDCVPFNVEGYLFNQPLPHLITVV
jgi:DMSO/TMAO reductase YedYZ molybdopterin-dependent catalytic subunit